LADDFWQNIFKYQNLGFDPIGWISNCSNEVDYFSLGNSFEQIKHNSWANLSWFDSFQYSGRNPDITRRIYNVNESISDDLKNKKIISLMRIHNDVAEDQQKLSHLLNDFFGKKSPKHQLRRVVLTTTSQYESQFGLVDYIDTHRGNKLGYTAVNISSGKLIDPDEEPDSMVNTSIGLAGHSRISYYLDVPQVLEYYRYTTHQTRIFSTKLELITINLQQNIICCLTIIVRLN